MDIPFLWIGGRETAPVPKDAGAHWSDIKRLTKDTGPKEKEEIRLRKTGVDVLISVEMIEIELQRLKGF